jgi:hypothetical protein
MSRLSLALAILSLVVGDSTAWSKHGPHSAGGARPCSLDGVNPPYHPSIFRNAAVALKEYGFVQSKDGTWHVVPNCHII